MDTFFGWWLAMGLVSSLATYIFILIFCICITKIYLPPQVWVLWCASEKYKTYMRLYYKDMTTSIKFKDNLTILYHHFFILLKKYFFLCDFLLHHIILELHLYCNYVIFKCREYAPTHNQWRDQHASYPFGLRHKILPKKKKKSDLDLLTRVEVI